MVTLFDYQVNAIKSWMDAKSMGIFEMATGTGKTYTALGCVYETYKHHNDLVVIISVPYQHLCDQWKASYESFFGRSTPIVIANSSHTGWKSLLWKELNKSEKLVAITTHNTLVSNDFASILGEYKEKKSYMLIGDEVHHLGSQQRRKALSELFDFRLGLSATPSRWMDEDGTGFIQQFFGKVVFEFDIKQALTTTNELTGFPYLTPYSYLPSFIHLLPDEYDEYVEITTKLVQYINRNEKDELDLTDSKLSLLLFKRANIVKNAFDKYRVLSTMLDELRAKDELHHTIIYCSPQQIDVVGKMLYDRKIKCNRFTMNEGTKAEERFNHLSERDHILKSFAEGRYQVLLSMKCLDEGVDIPSAKTGILMSSCGNPREYIQRIGRMIRYYPQKNRSKIYDIVIKPTFLWLSLDVLHYEKRIFLNELKRYESIGMNAINAVDVMELVAKERSLAMEVCNEQSIN